MCLKLHRVMPGVPENRIRLEKQQVLKLWFALSRVSLEPLDPPNTPISWSRIRTERSTAPVAMTIFGANGLRSFILSPSSSPAPFQLSLPHHCCLSILCIPVAQSRDLTGSGAGAWTAMRPIFPRRARPACSAWPSAASVMLRPRWPMSVHVRMRVCVCMWTFVRLCVCVCA